VLKKLLVLRLHNIGEWWINEYGILVAKHWQGRGKKLTYSQNAATSVKFLTKFWPALGSSPGLPDEYKGCFPTVWSTKVLLWKSNESGSYKSFYLFRCFSSQSVILCKLLCCTVSNYWMSAKFANCEEKFNFILSRAFEHSHPVIKCSFGFWGLGCAFHTLWPH